MLGAEAGLGKVAVGPFDERIFVAMGKLASHGIVSELIAFIGFAGALFTVRIIIQMITYTFSHDESSGASFMTTTRMRLHAKSATGNTVLTLFSRR